ncbi:MAG: sterol desaturase family protein [Chitinophagales bacterium]|nr:sterol desaturase family protein [Chitinophagales bacterium]
MKESLYTLMAIPFFLGLILVELIYQWRKHKELYRLNDALTNLNIGIGNIIMNLFTRGLVFGLFFWVSEHISLLHLKPGWMSVVILLVVYDFCFYWAHRYGHQVNFFWAAHVVHHQSEDYNLSVALRQSWIHSTIAIVFFLPIALLGVDIISLGIAMSVNSFYQFWIHTQAIKRMPKWFEFIFNTPSHHRVHHGVNPKYIDKNHGGMFIIWDRLFGTFKEEEEAPTYGITTQLKSWNPVYANTHYYIDMVKAAKKMLWKDRLTLLFAKPGWLPEYLGGYQAPPEVDKISYRKFNDHGSKSQNIYVLAQFVFILLGACAFIYYYEGLHIFFKIAGFVGLILSTAICGAIMEQKKWVRYAEYFRIAMILIGLNALYFVHFIDWFQVTLVASLVLGIYFIVWFTLNTIYQTSFIGLTKKIIAKS